MARMLETGLIFGKWTDQYAPKPYQCLMSNKKENSGPPARLTIQNLSGAFTILLIGYVVSVFVFFSEKLVGRCCIPSKSFL